MEPGSLGVSTESPPLNGCLISSSSIEQSPSAPRRGEPMITDQNDAAKQRAESLARTCSTNSHLGAVRQSHFVPSGSLARTSDLLDTPAHGFLGALLSDRRLPFRHEPRCVGR